jgi:hypothetical protein
VFKFENCSNPKIVQNQKLFKFKFVPIFEMFKPKKYSNFKNCSNFKNGHIFQSKGKQNKEIEKTKNKKL